MAFTGSCKSLFFITFAKNNYGFTLTSWTIDYSGKTKEQPFFGNEIIE